MSKLYQLKNWYSLEDAAKRLSASLGEEVTVKDVLQLTIEGHLPLSWYTRHVYALSVAPYTRVYDLDESYREMTRRFFPEREFEPRKISLEYEAQQQTVVRLDGPFTLDLEISSAMKDWVLSLVTDSGGELICLDGYFVRDTDGGLWQIVERFSPEQIKERLQKYPFGSREENHRANYFPSGGSPDPSDLGITKRDMEAFEAGVLSKPQADNGEKPLKTTERNTLLKMLIGMAVAGYRYSPGAAKNAAVSEIASDLEKLGIAVSDDTIRKWLYEAAELLPQQVDR